MKILQIISGRGVNGALVYCKFLSRQLAAQGHQVTILCRPNSWLVSGDEEPYSIKTSSLSRFPGELKLTADWIRSQNFDVIHSHMSRGHSFGLLMRMMTGVPVVATAHCRRMQPHWAMNDYVIANSDYTLDYQRRFNRVPEKKIETIHCFTDLSRFSKVTPRDVRIVRRQLRLKGTEFLVGVVGEVVQRKGHLYLFRALSEIVRHVPKLKVVLLGRFHRDEAYVKRLRRIVKRERLFCHVKWLGLRSNVQDFMTAFDLLVVPSVEEPLGLVALEAHASGTAVVAARTGGLTEIVRHEENGLLFQSKNHRELAQSVVSMAEDDELRIRCGETGKREVQERFAPEILTDQVLNVYNKLLHKRASAA